MYNRALIKECLFNLVGWRQTTNPDYPVLDDLLLTSDSSEYYQDGHPLITIENIDSIAKNYDSFAFPGWDIATTYNTGDRVRFTDNQVYESLVDNNLGNQPDTSPNDWKVVNLLSLFIEEKQLASINTVFNKVFTSKKLDKNVKDPFVNKRLYDWTRSLKDKVIKKGRFVGLEIVPQRDINVTVVLQKFGTDLTDLNPDLTIYIYHSSQAEPLDTFNINHDKVNSHVWTPLTDKVLSYMTDFHDAGGSFYIGYYEDDLEGQAIEKTNIDWRIGPRKCCSGYSYDLFLIWNRYLSVMPFSVASQDLDPDRKLWDVDKTNDCYCTNFGINLELSVKCDLTDFICNQKLVFTEAIQKHLALDLIKEMAYNTRNNYIAAKAQQMIEDIKLSAHFAIQNKDNNTIGLADEVYRLIKAVDLDMSHLKSVCMPCRNSRGVVSKTA